MGSPASRAAARAVLEQRCAQVPRFIWLFQPHEPEDSLPTYQDLATDRELLRSVGHFELVVLFDATLTPHEFLPTYEGLLQNWKDKGRYYIRFRSDCASVDVLPKSSKTFREIKQRAGAPTESASGK